MKAFRFDHAVRHIVCMAVSIGIVATLLPLPVRAAEPIDTLATAYQPAISESADASGFKHPGVGFTREMLENMRNQVRAKKEPWNSHFNDMLTTGAASRTPGIANVSATNPSLPRIYGIASQGDNGLFKTDALTAYTQAILYYVTGDEVYRANAMRIIRLHEQMDPARFLPFTDSHIHTGIPLSRMVGAAEILRYTSTQNPALEWTEDDTLRFSANLVIPVMQVNNNCNCRFMNQHLYTTIGKMSGSIFIADRAQYDEAVEWFTVNKDAPDPAWTGSIKQLFRLVTRNDATGEEVPPNIQHVEMGRDQAHGAGDLTNAQILSRMMMAQGTRVDPVTGTPSAGANAVGPYEFLDDRMLAVHELFGSFMVGYEIPWVPTAMSVYPDGSVRAIYPSVSGSYRGRLTQNTWEAYYYYKYARGIDMEQRAPNFTRMYAKRRNYNWSGVDGGGDFWMAIPKESRGGRRQVSAAAHRQSLPGSGTPLHRVRRQRGRTDRGHDVVCERHGHAGRHAPCRVQLCRRRHQRWSALPEQWPGHAGGLRKIVRVAEYAGAMALHGAADHHRRFPAAHHYRRRCHGRHRPHQHPGRHHADRAGLQARQ
jgi:hypothetical protein